MGNIFKVSYIDKQLRDTPYHPMPHNKKEMERAKMAVIPFLAIFLK